MYKSLSTLSLKPESSPSNSKKALLGMKEVGILIYELFTPTPTQVLWGFIIERQLVLLMLSVKKWSVGLDQRKKNSMRAHSGSRNLLSSHQELRKQRELAKIHIKMTNPAQTSLVNEDHLADLFKGCPFHSRTPELRQNLLMDKSPDNQAL